MKFKWKTQETQGDKGRNRMARIFRLAGYYETSISDYFRFIEIIGMLAKQQKWD